jgi:hypothetical protein
MLEGIIVPRTHILDFNLKKSNGLVIRNKKPFEK